MRSLQLKSFSRTECGHLAVYTLYHQNQDTILTLNLHVETTGTTTKVSFVDLTVSLPGAAQEEALDKIAEWLARAAETSVTRGKAVPLPLIYLEEEA